MRLSRVTAGFRRLGAQFADVLLTEYTSISVGDVIKYIFVRNGLTATSGCSAAGSAPALGAGCREFKSLHSDHNRTPILIQFVSKRVSGFFLQKFLFARLFLYHLTKAGSTVTGTWPPQSLFAFYTYIPFIERKAAHLFRVAHFASFLCDYSYFNSITADSPPNNSVSFSAARSICPSLV